MPPVDRLQRPLRALRLSVTDRCNLRCQYCMPEAHYRWLPREDLLTFEELVRVTSAAVQLGVRKVRLTGGEPLLRRDLPELVGRLAKLSRLEELALTTNGVLLEAQAQSLLDAGLKRLTISLDTLQPDRFLALARRDQLPAVLRGIETAQRVGFKDIKLDSVIIRDINDDEILELLGYARSIGAELRLIEYMDVGGATRWRARDVVSRSEMLARISRAAGPVTALSERGSAPAERFSLGDGTTFGIIASTTAPFCAACDRARLTADGHWYQCLYSSKGLDVRALIREQSASDADLCAALSCAWSERDDRGAQVRLGLGMLERGPLVTLRGLRSDPRLEMHTRGG